MTEVRFINGIREATATPPLYQWDYGQELHIYGLESTDATIQVHFCDKSCDRTTVRLATYVPTNDVSNFEIYYKVQIPDGLLENSYPINAFIYVVDAVCGQTTHHISIPVVARKKPAGFISEPDSSQTTQLEQALIDVNEANEIMITRCDEITTYINGKITETRTYVDSEVGELKTYTDRQVTDARSYTDSKYDSNRSYIQSEISNVENAIRVNASAISDLDSKVETLEEADTSMDERITALEYSTGSTELGDRVTTLENNMGDIQSGLTINNSNVESLTNDVRNLSDYYQELEARMNNLYLAVGGIIKEVTGNELEFNTRYKVIDVNYNDTWATTVSYDFVTRVSSGDIGGRYSLNLLENLGSYTGYFFIKVKNVEEKTTGSLKYTRVTYELNDVEHTIDSDKYPLDTYLDNTNATISIAGYTNCYKILG